MRNMATEYIDDYATCDKTYATLRVYTGDMSPDFVSKILGVEASEKLYIGKIADGRLRPAKLNGWFLTSKGSIDSLDARRHIDWLLDQLIGKEDKLSKVIESANEVYVSCFWGSAQGHGGPRLSPSQMSKLVQLNLELDWDIYI